MSDRPRARVLTAGEKGVLANLAREAAAIRKLEAQLGAAKRRRDLLIQKAIGCGFTERDIARVAYLTGTRVHQIKERARG